MPKFIFLNLFGNFLEFYEFTLFAYMIPIISPILFFESSLVDTYITGYVFLAISFLARPLGAVLLGYIGDIYGRKQSLILSIFLMSIATLGIGLLPTGQGYGHISLPMLFVCRFLQGISAGGEYSGAGLSLIESKDKRGAHYFGGLLTFSALLGAFTASIVSALISILEISNAWRFCFIIGGLMGVIILFGRLSIQDTNFSDEENRDSQKENLSQYFIPLLCTFWCSGLMNVPFYIVTGFLNTYMIAVGVFDKTNLMLLNAVTVLFCAIVTFIFTINISNWGAKKMMLIGSFGMTVFAIPFFWLVNNGNWLVFLIAELMLIALSQLFVAPCFATLARQFPKSIRFRCFAISNCCGIAVFGGITPYLSSKMIEYTGVRLAPAFYLMLVALGGFLFSIRQSKAKEEDKKAKQELILC